MKLESNSLNWNWNELEHELELKDMKCTKVALICPQGIFFPFFGGTEMLTKIGEKRLHKDFDLIVQAI